MRSKPERPSTLAVFDTITDKPRDLDDPFGDPDAQRQIGTAPADKARAGKRGR